MALEAYSRNSLNEPLFGTFLAGAMRMPKSLATQIGLLRTLVTQLERRQIPFVSLTPDVLRQEGIAYVLPEADGIVCLRNAGHRAFADLVDSLLNRIPAMERGVTYADVKTELFGFLGRYVGRERATIGKADAEALISHFEHWLASNISLRRVFVPCSISRTPAPRFKIGPITFEYIDRVATSDFYPRLDADAILQRRGFDDLVQWMRERDGDWLARVSVDGCERKRAEEVAELAVDLAIVALQLAAPNLHTRTMARLDARKGNSQKYTVSEAKGYYSAGGWRKEPGMTIGSGTLPYILEQAAPIFRAVGNVVRSFATGSFRLRVLERAWCDAAYWLHEALAESIDTIAIAKLETALEVLLGAESRRGSEQRILEILSAFFGLLPADPIAPESSLSARQFARNLVRDRSRILHGTWSTLNARGIDRTGIEGFAITVLRAAVVELEGYINSASPADDIDQFLSWVRHQRLTSANP